ncbi:MAG: peptidoglycan DD-metalloendopeptidase family protein [Prochlorotrichaceae cyanobacterium]
MIGLCLPLMAQGVSSSTAPNDLPLGTLERYQQELGKYYDNVLKAQGQLKQFQSLTQGTLIQLQEQLQATEQNLAENEHRLQLAQQFLSLLQKDWIKAQANYQALQNQVVTRLRWIQKQPQVQGWAALIQSEDLANFFQKRYRIRLLYEADVEQLKTVQASFAVLQQRRFDIENQKNEIALIQEQLLFQKSQAETQVANQNSLSDRLRRDRLALDAALARLEQDSTNLGQLIRDRRSRQLQPVFPNIYPGGSAFIAPVVGAISSEFGWRIHPISGTERFHSGIDFAVDYGTPIAAVGAGQVIFAGWYGGYGNAVIIDHGDGLTTLYAHTSELLINEGNWVNRGTIVATVGSTGYSTGPHLHFEVREDGEPVDPMRFL